MINVLKVVMGAIAGSAANSLIYRLPRKVNWGHGRSFCPHCRHPLVWYDLLPILSYLQLGGKCRYCHRPISIRYLFVELLMVAGFVSLPTPLLWALWFVTIVIAVMDWETMLVSDWLVAIWAIFVGISIWPLTLANLYGLLVGLGVIGGIWAVSKGRAMGFGDVEIALVMGLWLGWPKIWWGLWAAFVLGGVVGAYYLLTKQKKLKSQLAFGPFLIVGAWIALLVQWSYVFPI